MRLEDLEDYLEVIIASSPMVKSSQEASITVNNMLAVCVNLMSMKHVLDSELRNDNYKIVMMTNFSSMSASFVSATLQRLAEMGILYQTPYVENPNKVQNTPYFAPNNNFANMAQPTPQPMMYQQAPYQQQNYVNVQPQPQAMPINQPTAPTPQPVQPQQAYKPAQAQTTTATQPKKEEKHSSLDDMYVSEDNGSSEEGGADEFNLMGGGGDEQAAGRDFLLSILSKK